MPLCSLSSFAPALSWLFLSVFVQWSSSRAIAHPYPWWWCCCFSVIAFLLCAIACTPSVFSHPHINTRTEKMHTLDHDRFLPSCSSSAFLTYPETQRGVLLCSKEELQAMRARVYVYVHYCICCPPVLKLYTNKQSTPSLPSSIDNGCRSVMSAISSWTVKEKLTERRSIPAASSLGTRFSRGIGLYVGKSGRYSGNLDTPGQVSSVGVPRILKILSNWSLTEDPGNSGLPEAISAKMHPADQISIEVEYCFEPINTSGALYHSVTT